MYEWLEKEIAAVATRKFFLTALDSGSESGEEVELDQLPKSYAEFMRKFGKSTFFRDSTDCYAIGILGKPQRVSINDGEYWYVGWYDEATILLKESRRPAGKEWPVYLESKYGRKRRVADSFGEWLRVTWDAVRAKYSERKWKKILQGPEPFTAEELEIVEARKDFRWRLLGVDKNCTMTFEICNGSNRRLAYIGIGVHGKRRGVWLGVVLEVDHIFPGKSAIVEYNKFPPGMLDPDEIEVFENPDPGPEDREFYWELKSLPIRPEGNGARRRCE